MKLRAFRPVVLFTFVLAGGCSSGDNGSRAVGAESTCGLPATQPPTERPVDSCRDGDSVFGPVRVERTTGAPTDETFSFNVPAGGIACISVISSGENDQHRVASASIWLNDERVIGPSPFNQNVTTVERRIVIEGGDHHVRIRVSSRPGTWVDVTIKVGGTGEQHGLVQSNHLELFNLWAEPQVFSPSLTSIDLFGQGTVLSFAGLPSGQDVWAVEWAFEIRDVASCEIVRTLPGGQPIHTPSTFAAMATWDGTSNAGEPAGDGAYAYRLVARLLRGDQVIDEVATAQQPLLLDATPPVVTIVVPEDGALLTSDPEVVVNLQDPGTGINLASVTVLIDGEDRTAELSLTADHITGSLGVADGAHVLECHAADMAGNVTSANSTFGVLSVPAEAAEFVGEDGGVVEVTDPESPFYGVTVTVPPGDPVVVAVAPEDPDSSPVPSLPLPGAGVSPPVPVYLSNQVTVEICVPYDAATVALLGALESDVRLLLQPEAQSWQELSGRHVDVLQGMVCAQSDQFSFVQAVILGAESDLVIERIAGAYSGGDPSSAVQHNVALGPLVGLTSTLDGSIAFGTRATAGTASWLNLRTVSADEYGRVFLGRNAAPPNELAYQSSAAGTVSTMTSILEGGVGVLSPSHLRVRDLDENLVEQEVLVLACSYATADQCISGDCHCSISKVDADGNIEPVRRLPGLGEFDPDCPPPGPCPVPDLAGLLVPTGIASSFHGLLFMGVAPFTGGRGTIRALNLGTGFGVFADSRFLDQFKWDNPILVVPEPLWPDPPPQPEILVGGGTDGDRTLHVNIPAHTVSLENPRMLTLSPMSMYGRFDGLIYFVEGNTPLLRVANLGFQSRYVLGYLVEPGDVMALAGGGALPFGDAPDGTPHRDLDLSGITGLAVSMAGAVLLGDGQRVRVMASSRAFSRVAGDILAGSPPLEGMSAIDANIQGTGELFITRYNDLVFLDTGRDVVHLVGIRETSCNARFREAFVGPTAGRLKSCQTTLHVAADTFETPTHVQLAVENHVQTPTLEVTEVGFSAAKELTVRGATTSGADFVHVEQTSPYPHCVSGRVCADGRFEIDTSFLHEWSLYGQARIGPRPAPAAVSDRFVVFVSDVDMDGFMTNAPDTPFRRDRDNCPLIANELQQDSDGDGIGDSCEACIPSCEGRCTGDDGCGGDCSAINSPETDTEFCARYEQPCGILTACDNCGEERTADCSDLTAAECGLVEVGSCGAEVDCGGCPGGQACRLADNTCCWPETDQAYCARLGAECGDPTPPDNCGWPRTADCGTCTAPYDCGAQGAANQCMCPQTNQEICQGQGFECGPATVTDACGDERYVWCDDCTYGTCTDNACVCTPLTCADIDTGFCQPNPQEERYAWDDCGGTVGPCFANCGGSPNACTHPEGFSVGFQVVVVGQPCDPGNPPYNHSVHCGPGDDCVTARFNFCNIHNYPAAYNLACVAREDDGAMKGVRPNTTYESIDDMPDVWCECAN